MAEETPQTNKKTYSDRIPELLDYSSLFHYFGLYKSTVSKLVMLGEFTDVVKVGRKNYFRKEDVEAWIDAQTIKVSA